MHVLTICNHKGGTGKTTSAIHVAAALGMSGRRTLVIDLDPQGFLTRTMGIAEPPEAESSLALFDHQVRLRDVAAVPVRSVDILTASYGLTRPQQALKKLD